MFGPKYVCQVRDPSTGLSLVFLREKIPERGKSTRRAMTDPMDDPGIMDAFSKPDLFWFSTSATKGTRTWKFEVLAEQS